MVLQTRQRGRRLLSTKPGVYYPPLRKAMDRRLQKLERRHAQPIQIVARRAVIICAGGFIANTEWRERYAPEFVHGLPLGTTGAVLNAAGEPVLGLFSAGRTAIGICSQSYVSGLSIADCVFAGRRAGA